MRRIELRLCAIHGEDGEWPQAGEDVVAGQGSRVTLGVNTVLATEKADIVTAIRSGRRVSSG